MKIRRVKVTKMRVPGGEWLTPVEYTKMRRLRKIARKMDVVGSLPTPRTDSKFVEPRSASPVPEPEHLDTRRAEYPQRFRPSEVG